MDANRAGTPEDSERREWRGWVNADAGTVETRNADGDTSEALRISGYAAVFDQPSERMGMVEEVIDARAFDGIDLRAADVRVLADHGGLALARTQNGTLRLETDEKGLRFEADLNPQMAAARDLHAAIERGDITQMSFGFTIGGTQRMDCDHQDCDLAHLRITEVRELFEISAVTFPAYPQTSVGMPADRGAAMGDNRQLDELVALSLNLAHGGDHHGSSDGKAGSA